MSKAQEIKKPIDAFFDDEYLGYAKYVVENRAIPSAIDGFKPTQRKVICAANRVWKSGNEKMLLNFNKSIDSLGKVYQAIANKIKSDNENLSQLELTKINSLLEQIHTQEKAAGEIKLAIDNNAPAFYVLETAVPAAKSEKPNIPEVLILTALISWLFCAMALLIYNREDSL